MKNSKFKTFVTVYAILISGWFLSWLIVGDVNWWLVLFNRTVPYLFVPLLVLLIWGVHSREYRYAVLLLAPVLIFSWLYHPYLFPKISRSIPSELQLRVMTYNVLFSNSDYRAVADVILTHEPDLVALQEVKIEMMNALKGYLAEKYPYSLLGTENEYGTTAIFSKYPIEASHVLNLQVDRPAALIKTKVNGRDVTFASLHLLAYNLWWTKLKDIPEVVMQRTADQNRQARILLDYLNAEDGVVIVACDCNSYETASSYRILDEVMNNPTREMGWRFRSGYSGVKQDTALQHIDYVWFRGDVEPIHVYRIINTGGSDHHPVLAVFDFP